MLPMMTAKIETIYNINNIVPIYSYFLLCNINMTLMNKQDV